MKPPTCSVILELPALSDAVAVQLRECLYDFVSAWENRYSVQIRRYTSKQLQDFAPDQLSIFTEEKQMDLFDEVTLPPF